MKLISKLERYIGKKIGYQVMLTRLAKEKSGMRVSSGPFEGMEYVGRAYNAAYLPKLIGCYEREITPVIEEAVSGEFDLIVDVGSAEGYFAVGMASRCDTPVIAFEMHDAARELSKSLAEKNKVFDRICFEAECDQAGLEKALAEAENPFVLIDVEGYEAELLKTDQVPSLTKASLLVEVHEFARPGITAELFRRFDRTHQIEVYWQGPRTAEDYPYEGIATRVLTKRMVRKAVDEDRTFRQSWLWMRPLAQAAQSAA